MLMHADTLSLSHASLAACSASTAIKRYMQLCRIQQTDSCLSPLDDAAQLAPLADKWHEYFVFTFVSVSVMIRLGCSQLPSACWSGVRAGS